MTLESTANIVCPGCGYDLRGRASDRCPECGLDVADIESRPSAIPWVHRRKLGRVRAYVATLIKLHGPTKWIASEVSRPVDAASAKSFRRTSTALLCAMALPLAFGLRSLAGDDPTGIFSRSGIAIPSGPTEAWLMTDVALPWTIGYRQSLTLAVATLTFVACWTGLPSLWFWPRSLDFVRRTRASWLSMYASALVVSLATPLVLIAFILMAGPGRSTEWVQRIVGESSRVSPRAVAQVSLLALLLFAFVLAIWNWTRLNGLLRKTCEPGFVRSALLMIGFPLASTALLVLCGFGLPWVAGFITLVARATTR